MRPLLILSVQGSLLQVRVDAEISRGQVPKTLRSFSFTKWQAAQCGRWLMPGRSAVHIGRTQARKRGPARWATDIRLSNGHTPCCLPLDLRRPVPGVARPAPALHPLRPQGTQGPASMLRALGLHRASLAFCPLWLQQLPVSFPPNMATSRRTAPVPGPVRVLLHPASAGSPKCRDTRAPLLPARHLAHPPDSARQRSTRCPGGEGEASTSERP